MCASVAAGKYSAEVSVFDLRQVLKKKKTHSSPPGFQQGRHSNQLLLFNMHKMDQTHCSRKPPQNSFGFKFWKILSDYFSVNNR